MILAQRWFTLIELMIVIAIIAILATALFPTVSNYIERGRDAARVSHLKDISNAIGAYFADFNRFPPANPANNGCLNSWALGSAYFPVFPVDPLTWRQNWCGANGVYWYATWTWYAGSPQFITTATFESDWWWNVNNNGSTSVVSLAWTWIFYFSQRTNLDISNTVRKWNGSGYIMYK